MKEIGMSSEETTGGLTEENFLTWTSRDIGWSKLTDTQVEDVKEFALALKDKRNWKEFKKFAKGQAIGAVREHHRQLALLKRRIDAAQRLNLDLGGLVDLGQPGNAEDRFAHHRTCRSKVLAPENSRQTLATLGKISAPDTMPKRRLTRSDD
jgi:hypothetical protein